jgi:hypothetical protein
MALFCVNIMLKIRPRKAGVFLVFLAAYVDNFSIS